MTDIELATIDELVAELNTRTECSIMAYVVLDGDTVRDGTEHVTARWAGVGYKCLGLAEMLRVQLQEGLLDDD